MSRLIPILLLLVSPALFAATYYVQPNGGPRYSATYNPSGDSCNGQSNANMVTSGGPNQTCAYSDVRYLWADGSTSGSWALAGGDTAIIANTYPSSETGWRVGSTNSSGGRFNNFVGYQGVNGWPLPVPSGTSGNPTQILGANYASCQTTQSVFTTGVSWPTFDPSKTTQLYGGWNAYSVLNLEGSQYVTLQCLEVTDHNSCIKYGNAGLPSTCSSTSDYATFGIMVNNQTANVTMQDVNIHGLPSAGLYGAIGGPFTLTRFRSAFNGFAGWNFDDGTANWTGAAITASYVTMEFNGCNEEYPITDPIPSTYCYSQGSGGFGDGFSGQNAYLSSFHGDHLLLRYNTKDPFFGPHTSIGDIKITDSIAYGNGGQTWKWNSGITGTVLFQNNLTMNDCNRMSAAMTGAPSTYNTYFVDPCRADGSAMAFLLPINGSFEMDGNTFVTTGVNVSFDLTCWNQLTGISSTPANGGTGYQVGDVLLLGGDAATATVTSVGSGGAITGLSLTTNGHAVSAAPYTETYIGGGHGSGAQISVTSSTPANCSGGSKIMRDNIFYAVTDPLTPSYNSSPVALFCYPSCAGSAGTFTDANWTTRSNNIFGGTYKTNTGQCSYATESCADPKLVSEPPTTLVSESQFDSTDFHLTGTSPAIGAGVTVTGLTTDYFGTTRPNPPSMGAIEYAGSVTYGTAQGVFISGGTIQ